MFNHARPVARIRLRSETIPFVIAPIVAIESILSVKSRDGGQALVTIAAAAISAIKLFPSDRTTSSPDHTSLWSLFVIKIPLPELGLLPEEKWNHQCTQ